jgi:hypothetical protein
MKNIARGLGILLALVVVITISFPRFNIEIRKDYIVATLNNISDDEYSIVKETSGGQDLAKADLRKIVVTVSMITLPIPKTSMLGIPHLDKVFDSYDRQRTVSFKHVKPASTIDLRMYQKMETDVIFDARGLSNDRIKEMLKQQYVTTSLTRYSGQQIDKQLSIGEALVIEP